VRKLELLWERLEGRDGHAVGRELLARMVDPLPEICKTELGKPYFRDNGLHFSISHTKEHVFCCVSTRNVSIDAEEMDRPVGTGMLRMLSPRERALCAVDGDLLRLWVLKESFAKLTGKGIGNYLKTTEFSPDDPRIQEIDGCYVAIMEE
jgi:phosphopantetheinyl transferase